MTGVDGEGPTQAAEVVVNGDGEVAIFVPALRSRPVGGRREEGGAFRICMADGEDAFVGCPPEAHAAIVESGRMLLVECEASGRPVRESWVAVAP